jgi:hypothetical protein
MRVVGALAVASALSACADRPTSVAVRVTLDGLPVPGLDVTAYPFDPDRLLDSLAAAFPEPRPDFTSLERELLAFRPPQPPAEDTAEVGWRATRDSVVSLADSLNAVDRRAAGYADAYRRFRQLYMRLVQRSAMRESARRADLDPVRELARRAGRGADSLRTWERRAYAGFDSAVARLADETGRKPALATTAADGWLDLELPPGPWWLEARLPHRDNPFAEYTWLAGIVSAGFPFRLLLSETTATLEWRH